MASNSVNNYSYQDFSSVSSVPSHLFVIKLCFKHFLQLSYPEDVTIPWYEMYQTITFLREEFLSFQTGPTFIASILSSTGSPSHIIGSMVRDIYNFAWEMQTSHKNDTEPRGLLMVINLFAMTPYDDRETIDRILSESSIVPRFRPANKDAIRKLEKVKVQDLKSTTQCTVCLEDVNLEVVRMPCSHLYHEECIVKWLETNCTCPLCRYELPCSED